jgi:hypothetical protein
LEQVNDLLSVWATTLTERGATVEDLDAVLLSAALENKEVASDQRLSMQVIAWRL